MQLQKVHSQHISRGKIQEPLTKGKGRSKLGAPATRSLATPLKGSQARQLRDVSCTFRTSAVVRRIGSSAAALSSSDWLGEYLVH